MATLQIPKTEASEILGAQIHEGNVVADRALRVPSREDFDAWRRQQTQWMGVTKDAQRHIYGGDDETERFEEAATHRTATVQISEATGGSGGLSRSWADKGVREEIARFLEKAATTRS